MRDKMVSLAFTIEEARAARIKNIIEMGLASSVMMRVFSKRSNAPILKRLAAFFTVLEGVKEKAEYERCHADFCRWFIRNISTAERRHKSQRATPSHGCSYGQAAKVLDVSAKVYVYYCGQPSPEAARRLVPILHAALDGRIMLHLGISKTLQAIDRGAYKALQDRVAREIGVSRIHPVQYDDIVWRRLQRPQYPSLP